MDEDRTLGTLVVTEGRAYHRGDVVLLRVKNRRLDEEFLAHARLTLDKVTEKTGVEFLILDQNVEVVEPRGDD